MKSTVSIVTLVLLSAASFATAAEHDQRMDKAERMEHGIDCPDATEAAEDALARIAAVGKQGAAAEKHYKALHAAAETSAKAAARGRKMTCDNIGKVIICTDGKAVCWWGPKNGYGCSF